MIELEAWQLVLLFFVGGFTGFIDAIAGGGGIISLPILLALGFPPHLALGTNKFQGSFGTFFSTWHYRRAGLMRVRDLLFGFAFAATGSFFGTLCVRQINAQFLKVLVPWLLLCIFLFTLLSPKLGHEDKHKRLAPKLFYMLCGLLIGFYDGFFGPGAGTFWTIAFVTLLGFNLKKATAHTKFMNFSSNSVAITSFLLAGLVVIPAGIAMACGQFFGAFLGARMVIRKEAPFIRIFFLSVVAITLLRLFWQMYF